MVLLGSPAARPGCPVLEALGQLPISEDTLAAIQEGLALTNGTSLMAALASLAVHRAENILITA
ncbi:MAG TPA: histidine ammonia-lyase, partial [Anaerolineae bacterium]|nr:histidine ammonia-lyase [Anaerolineae bacterium]